MGNNQQPVRLTLTDEQALVFDNDEIKALARKAAMERIRAAIFLRLFLIVGWSILIAVVVSRSAAGWTTWNWNRIAMCLTLSAVIAAMVYDAAVCITRYRKLKRPTS